MKDRIESNTIMEVFEQIIYHIYPYGLTCLSKQTKDPDQLPQNLARPSKDPDQLPQNLARPSKDPDQLPQNLAGPTLLATHPTVFFCTSTGRKMDLIKKDNV